MKCISANLASVKRLVFLARCVGLKWLIHSYQPLRLIYSALILTLYFFPPKLSSVIFKNYVLLSLIEVCTLLKPHAEPNRCGDIGESFGSASYWETRCMSESCRGGKTHWSSELSPTIFDHTFSVKNYCVARSRVRVDYLSLTCARLHVRHTFMRKGCYLHHRTAWK